MGAQVLDVKAVQSAVQQHLAWLRTFEKIDVQLSVVRDGLESADFWKLVGLPGAPTDRCQFTATRPDLDADAVILANSAPAQEVVVDDLQVTSARSGNRVPSLALAGLNLGQVPVSVF